MHLKRSRRWFQFSLRSLMLAVTSLTVVLGSWVVREREQVRRQTVAAAKLRNVQAEIYARPTWVWTVLEPDSPGKVVGAAIRSRQATDDDLAPLANLSDLVWLNLNDTQSPMPVWRICLN
jgi:hypothetical protein